ncbi:cuticle protein-like [Armigeres subalbatus]|uniref:cuticle protein-like n=1 Tax=Armigeres subalbatus TaxID=124917 RepID=UPI002ECFC601
MLKNTSVLTILVTGGVLFELPQAKNSDQGQEWNLVRESKGVIEQQEPDAEIDQQRNPQKVSDDAALPNYEFAYGVHDPVTGDHKDQWEKRVGDHVQGVYTLDQPNGKKRIVEYEGDQRGVKQVVKEVDIVSELSRREQLNGIGHSYNILDKIDSSVIK